MSIRFVAMTALAAPDRYRMTLSRRFCVVDYLNEVVALQTDDPTKAVTFAAEKNDGARGR